MAAHPRKPLRERARSLFRSEYTCCGRTWHTHRAMNAHHLARHASRWTSAKARKTARDMGKAWDAARKHARGWQEAAGLRDPRGKLTPRGRSRPQPRGNVPLRDLRQLHRHDRDHERADAHDRKAARARARDQHYKANPRAQRARDLRNRWPEREPAPARTPPARPAPARSNGTRPAPARTRTP